MKNFLINAAFCLFLLAGVAACGLAAKNCRNPSNQWEVCERYADNDQQRLRCAIYFKPKLIDSTFYSKTYEII